MVDTAEDNFRIEVWDQEEKTHLETICRSPDALGSQAAWHAAIRGRRGVLLTHYNSRHVRRSSLSQASEGPSADDHRRQHPCSAGRLSW